MKSLARTLIGPFTAAVIIVAFEALSPFSFAGWIAAATAISAAALGTLAAGPWGGLATTVGVGAYLAIAFDSAGIVDARAQWSVAAVLFAGVAITVATAFLRKRAEDLPGERSRRTHLETVLDNLDAVVWESTPDLTHITYMSAGAENLLGHPLSRWMQENGFWANLIHPDDRDRVVEESRRAASEGRGHLLEYRMLASDGTIFWVNDVAKPVVDRKGRTVRLTGRLIDITHRKLAERRLSAVLAASRAMARSAPVNEIARDILRAVCHALEWQFGAVWTVNERIDKLVCIEKWHPAGRDLGEFDQACGETQFERGVGLPGRIWESNQPAWIPDVVEDDNFPRAAKAAAVGLHGAFGFPIRGNRGFEGIFEFFSDEIEQPDPELLDMMAAVGSHIGQVIERRRVEEHIAFQKALLEQISEATIDGVLVVSTEGELLSINQRLIDMWPIPEELTRPGRNPELIRALLEQIDDPNGAIERIGQLYGDMDEHAREEVVLKDGRIFDLWSAPLPRENTATDQGNGVFGRAWFFRDISKEKAAEKALSASRDRLQFLSEAGTEFAAASLEYEETLARIARMCVPQLADWCAVDVVAEDGSVRRVAVEHVDPAKVDYVRQLQEVYPPDPDAPRGANQVIRTGQSELYEEISDELLQSSARDEEHLRLLRELNMKSSMVVALNARDRIVGALTFVTAESDRTYTTEDLALAEALARRAGLALDNARLYRERTHIARTLQESLLPPSLPEIPGVEIAALYHAAGEGNDVGGDFYDVFQYGARKWAVVIGDVRGKGAEAAALTGLVRHTVRFEAMQEHEPGRIVTLLNDAVVSQGKGEQFCTLVYMRLDTSKEGVNLATVRAGHPPPLILRGDGTVDEIDPAGIPVGVSDQMDLEEEIVSLRPGDAVILYTDGVTDARSDHDTFGERRLRSLLSLCLAFDASQIAKQIETSVLEFCDGNVRDDIAILVVRVPS